MDLQNLDDFRSVEELVSYRDEAKSRLSALNAEFAGRPLPAEYRDEFAGLTDQCEEVERRVSELEARQRTIERLAAQETNRERIVDDIFGETSPRNRSSMRERDIFDLSTIRSDISRPETARGALRERALRAIEIGNFPQVRNQDAVRTHLANLVENFDSEDGEIARRILITGSPAYRRGFMKYVFGQEGRQTSEERAALAVGAGATGGYAIVYQLDPTFIPTSDLAVNPLRALGSVETISGANEWRGVTTAGVTASYANEATEASDNSPTLAQPAITVQRAQCFVPVSIELSQDLPQLQANLARLIQDAKDVLEATEFTTGTGVAPHPQGLLTGATTTVAAGGTAAFAIADLYALEAALGPRFRARGSFVGNRFVFQKIRGFDTAGGAAMWLGYPNPLQQGIGNAPGGALEIRLIGYPTYEDSAMAAALTTGSKLLVLGDFSYFKIIDRIGLDVEVIPHLFGPTNRFPTGQRGIYAYWRNSSKVLDPNAFRVLVTS